MQSSHHKPCVLPQVTHWLGSLSQSQQVLKGYCSSVSSKITAATSVAKQAGWDPKRTTEDSSDLTNLYRALPIDFNVNHTQAKAEHF